MRRALKIVAIAITLLVLGAWGYWAKVNPESQTLSLNALGNLPGEFVTLRDGATYYEVAGPDTAPVVVLVHGFSVPSYIWDSTFTALATAGFRVIRYDLYGRGWSERPDAAYDGEMYDAQLAGLLDSLRITQPVHLVGLSFGGYVTSHFVTTHPARVRSLTMIDPVASSSKAPLAVRLPVVGSWLFTVTQMPGRAEGQLSDFLQPELWPAWVEQYRPQMKYRGFGRSLHRSALTLSRTNFDTLFTAVAATGKPVALIWGKEDQTTPIALAEVVRRNIPSVEYVVIDSAAHLPQMERASVVNPLLVHVFTVVR
jgi:pimeloyl-ACP methyl ester carboxylesterase